MNVCVYSSLVFLTNSIAAYIVGEYIYSGSMCGLVASSLVFHNMRESTVAYWIDQVFVVSVTTCGACILYNRWDRLSDFAKMGAIISFCFSVYMYYINRFEPHADISDKWHSLLHYVCSVGHHFLLL